MSTNTLEAIVKDGEKIILAGVEWIVPKLRARQLPLVLPELMRFTRDCQDPEKVVVQVIPIDGKKVMSVLIVHRPTVEDVLNLVYNALVFNYPQLTRDVFDGLAIELEELIAALDPIRRASGLKVPSERKDGAPAVVAVPGEPGAPSETTGKTST